MAYIAGVEHLKHNVMKAQDLRLGNLYMRGNKVEEFTDQVMNEVIYGALQHCEPIQLTEEWLERFGFENGWIETKGGTIDMSGILTSKTTAMIGGEDSCTSGMCYLSLIKYVHQLQNLYHALTGEELTLK